MKNTAFGTTVRSNRHRVKDRFAPRRKFPRTCLHNHDNKNLCKPVFTTEQVVNENVAPINSLWINKVGNRIVGMARLVQDQPHLARIVLFHIDPEWCHTKVPMHLIDSIQSHCLANGQLKVVFQRRLVPSWMQTLMTHHGFQCMDKD